ncbi:MAG: alpha-L-rhamnosidase [Planctomycetota bacterium]
MHWTAKWIALPDAEPDVVVEYRLDCDRHIDTLHVSADQRFVLFADDVEIARGPTRGTVDRWSYNTVRVGREVHALRAIVWSLRDEVAPQAQQTFRHGFVLQADGCDTGSADWQARRLNGYTFSPMSAPYSVTFPGGLERFDATTADGPWKPVEAWAEAGAPLGRWGERGAPTLVPDPLPPMLQVPWTRQIVRHVDDRADDEPFESSDETARWQALIDDAVPMTVPPHSRVRLLLDLGDYVCGYDRTIATGLGARVDIGWQEALINPTDQAKRHRDNVTGMQFRGRWQALRLGAESVTHQTLWWSAGRYRCVVIETADAPATIESLGIIETRYPLELRSTQTVRPDIDATFPMCFRALQMCAHETYMDCPHYEQMQYVGDTRIQALVSYACTGDDRLARHALRMFARSVTPDGLVRARFPDRDEQVIPQFSLFYIGMLHDFLMWRDEPALVRECMPTVRGVCERFLANLRHDGLVDWPSGWNWVDWVSAWPTGNPPGAAGGSLSGINQWQLVYILGLAADLERFVGEDALADRLDRHAATLSAVIDATYWDESVGGWADTIKHDSFSEHAQCYAILSSRTDREKSERAGRLLDPSDREIHRGTFYFMHYVFEALHALGRGGEVLDRLAPWPAMRELGLRTTAERPEPTRSDCHAWSAHPLLHVHTTLAGVRPAAPRFAEVSINPKVVNIDVRMMHPRGEIAMKVDDSDVVVELPDGVSRV